MRSYSTIWTAGVVFLIGGMIFAPAVRAQAQALPLGSSLPQVEAQQIDGGAVALPSLAGPTGTVILFWSNQCPWVDRYTERVQALRSQFGGQGIRFVLINSNDAGAFPQESAEASRVYVEERGLTQMAYLRDQGSAVAQAFGAERTPHVFVFDGARSLVYVGAIDDSPGDPGDVEETYLEDALQALAAGEAVPVTETKAFGCRIKFAR